ncbi:uncharacterized protein LOC131287964 [Anopheles ziemanni]|uniref:uncharacterized protein LOC131259914 n=1 Tax=Anopheles coustani TaxID=139045 RepID=UPI002658E271|nr:uncharacterized protein LOC131259914 [Anopheles coustani]XP_058173042.1 uncharacterized protein LOC131287964 [Anopheles ziemanni]
MSRNLCDETFPASLLIEFDELDDEIPISPDLPKHHSLGAFPRHHSTLSGGPTIENASEKGHDDRNGSRMVISGSSNTSSGHSSLSTEGENRSASSERDTAPVPHRNEGAVLGDKLLLKPRKFRPPRSMESLLLQQHSPDGGKRTLRTLASAQQGTGLGSIGTEAGSCGNISTGSGGSQSYHRTRTKYGHIQSKVKKQIDEMKPNLNRERKSLIRHKSMPNTYEPNAEDVDNEILDEETNPETLRKIIREVKEHARNLEDQLTMRDLFHENVFNELATLKCKNSALRLENDQLHEQERAREQRRQVLRQCNQHGGSCYGSQSSLHKASLSTCSVSTQTSPREFDASDVVGFEFLVSPERRSLQRSSLSAGRRTVRSPIVEQPPASPVEPESMMGEFSPDYEQLIPMLGRRDDSSSFLHDLRLREQGARTPARTTIERSDTDQTHENGNGPGCRDCRKRRKKRKSRKQKLASLFCIRRHDESL